MKNGEQPINPVLDLNEDLSGLRGLTKLEYFAAKYADISDDFFKEVSAEYIMSFLGFDKDVNYVATTHYPQAIIKMQLIFANELLKQLNDGI